MISVLRPCLSFLLASLVALASISHAQARHQAQGATTMVICTGYGLVQITLDADGNPVEHSLPCPDCMLHKAVLPVDPSGISPLAVSAYVVRLQPVLHPSGRSVGLWPQGRAPPVTA